MISAAQAAELRSRFAPMPVGLHVGFCIFATVVFLLIYMRKRTLSSILWILICDATIILQLYGDAATATAVGICEIVLFAILAWASFGEYRAAKAAKKASDGDNDPSAGGSSGEPQKDEREDIAKLVKAERQKLNADSTGDIISNAFEDDKL